MDRPLWVGIPGDLTEDQRSALERAEIQVEERPPQSTAGYSEIDFKIYRSWVRVPASSRSAGIRHRLASRMRRIAFARRSRRSDAEDENDAKGRVGAAIGMDADQLIVKRV